MTNLKSALDLGKVVLIMLLIAGAGLFLVNQFFSWKYKAEFLQAPCKLCSELNPDVEKCIERINAPAPSYWTNEGWTNPYASKNLTELNLSLTP